MGEAGRAWSAASAPAAATEVGAVTEEGLAQALDRAKREVKAELAREAAIDAAR
ncbi:MAG: hypothetical protein ACE5R4_16280 [Armatimonadota bacterium]